MEKKDSFQLLSDQGIFARYELQMIEISTKQKVEIKQAHISQNVCFVVLEDENIYIFLFSGYFRLQGAQIGRNFNCEKC